MGRLEKSCHLSTNMSHLQLNHKNKLGLSCAKLKLKLKVVVEVEFGVDVEACHY